MAEVLRAHVCKREGYDVEAQGMLKDLRENLGVREIAALRLINRYDVQGLSREEYARVRDQVFAEPMVDDAWDEELALAQGETAFAIEYLPGQYDQRADSAVQCIALTVGKEAIVRTARIVVLTGEIGPARLELIKGYLINAVEARQAAMDKPTTLAMHYPEPPQVKRMEGFTTMGEGALEALRADMGMAMTQADIAFVQGYFRDEEKREPSVTELRVIDTYWSDHCRHTTFLTTLDEVTFDKEGLAQAIERSFAAYLADRQELGRQNPPCLMDMALTGPRLLKARGQLVGVDESEEINACSIRVTAVVDAREQEWLVMFKNETHNHPTEIEPFGGAATCLGGAIRDPLSGRSYVYQAMRVSGAGDPTVPVEDTLAGKLPQRKITLGALAGFSSYGNQIGLATGQVREIYHPGYVAKRMEIGAVVGAAPAANVRRERPIPGDVVVLLGGRTGRDGIGGATGSSKEHTQDSLADCGAQVQKGNPVTERKLQRLFRKSEVTQLIRRCNDFGAGGVAVAIGELAEGLRIDLDQVPRKYEGLDGTEIAISESQERMAAVVAQEDAQALIEQAALENVEATVVAQVTQEPRLSMVWRGDTIVDLSRAFLDTNGAEQHARAHVVSPDVAEHPYRHVATGDKALWEAALQDLNVASQQGLAERFDATNGAAAVLSPFGGKTQKTPIEAMAAKLPLQTGETHTATIMAHGYDPHLSAWSPYHGAMMAVVDSLCRLVAAGGDHESAYLTFQEYFEKLRDEPSRWGKPVAALLGALEAQKGMGVASIGGKDSMSGSFLDMDVPPTLCSFAICVGDDRHVRSPEWKRAGSRIVYLPTRLDADLVPDWTYQKKLLAAVRDGLKKGGILSARTVGQGGLAAAISQMCFGNELGAQIDNLPTSGLYEPEYGAMLLEVAGRGIDNWPVGLDIFELGKVTQSPCISLFGEDMPLEALLALWEAPLAGVFPIVGPQVVGDDAKMMPLAASPSPKSIRVRAFAQPRVFVPTFPGTNCEVDVARAFERVGGVAHIGVVRNASLADVEQTVLAFEQEIRRAQIVALPGGFSAGDEPEGSAKFIISLLNHPRIRDAVMDLIKNRDGLMLGICNGFQALVKVGLAPYGEYRPMAQGAPTLTFNTIDAHIARVVSTRINSKLSPWYALCEIGDVHSLPVSHGEGRFVASDKELSTLAERGQVATQYVDADAQPTMDPRHNVNGSRLAIEGLCSPDGRVLGKMGHSERMGRGVGINVPGDKDDKIFESGVNYYS